jgi:CheY-like chemotaxis protein
MTDLFQFGTVLLVDDDLSWLTLISTLVRDTRLLTCGDAKDVANLLETHPVKLIVTDTNMPGMSGVDLLKVLRANPKWASLPVIVLFSGYTGATITKPELMEMGATLVMSKDEFLTRLVHFVPARFGAD